MDAIFDQDFVDLLRQSKFEKQDGYYRLMVNLLLSADEAKPKNPESYVEEYLGHVDVQLAEFTKQNDALVSMYPSAGLATCVRTIVERFYQNGIGFVLNAGDDKRYPTTVSVSLRCLLHPQENRSYDGLHTVVIAPYLPDQETNPWAFGIMFSHTEEKDAIERMERALLTSTTQPTPQ
jgi:hypothetical protein